jgi:hypothetical protein
MKKALWVTSFSAGSLDRLVDHCSEAGISILCIRTTSSALPKAISGFNKHGIAVYGWRWPAVVPDRVPHHFATDEASYVVKTLIPAGLAGYIVDPESDGPGQVDDWNDTRHAQLASDFCAQIRAAAPEVFHFGTTSGCEYPRNHGQIPWAQFVEASDALYPQTYWRSDTNGSVHGGTPASSYALGQAAWGTIARGKPIVAMAGEIATALPQEILAYGELVKDNQEVAHFYADSPTMSPAVLKAIGSV